MTGASEGIGEGIAQALAAEGASVAICARTASKLEETTARVTKETGATVFAIPADMRTLDGCEGFVNRAAEKLGGIDIPVNNAGASAFGSFVDLPDEAFTDAINGKLLGYIRCSRAAIPHLQRRGGGTILNITGATQQAVPLHTPGSAFNAAVCMFSKELSMELGPMNIRVNSLGPGRIQTARADRLLAANAQEQGLSEAEILPGLWVNVGWRINHSSKIPHTIRKTGHGCHFLNGDYFFEVINIRSQPSDFSLRVETSRPPDFAIGQPVRAPTVTTAPKCVLFLEG